MSKLSEKSSSSFIISLSCSFWFLIVTKTYVIAASTNASTPQLFSFLPANTFIHGILTTLALTICAILALIACSQVAPSIIKRVVIFMVNPLRREVENLPMHLCSPSSRIEICLVCAQHCSPSMFGQLIVPCRIYQSCLSLRQWNPTARFAFNIEDVRVNRSTHRFKAALPTQSRTGRFEFIAERTMRDFARVFLTPLSFPWFRMGMRLSTSLQRVHILTSHESVRFGRTSLILAQGGW